MAKEDEEADHDYNSNDDDSDSNDSISVDYDSETEQDIEKDIGCTEIQSDFGQYLNHEFYSFVLVSGDAYHQEQLAPEVNLDMVKDALFAHLVDKLL